MRLDISKPKSVWTALSALMLSAFAYVPLAAAVQQSTPLPSDTASALVIEPERTLRFTTDEGTWVSLDVSPDGERIAFDLLGDLYTIPIAGGQATRLTQGMEFDATPRWSPDGSRIAFISDRDGGDNLWVVSPNGSGLRKLTKEIDSALGSPEWTPDGQYLVTRRFGPYPSAENYLTNVPLWMYHVDGGSGIQVFPQSPTRKSTNTGAAFSPDGGILYTSSHGGGYAGETLGSYQVLAFDLETGEETRLTAGSGGGLRPIASPDGKWLVYATRAGVRTALRIRDLSTHEDSWLVEETQRDDQEGYAPNDVFPGYSFTPDSRAVVFYGGGKIKRVELDTREVSVIPFSVDVEIEMGERLFIPLEIPDGRLPVTQLVSVAESPDGSQIAFSAVGKLWTADRGGAGIGTPERLTDQEERAYYPAFSPDGAWVAYITWSDSEGGHVWKARADGGGRPQRLTADPAYVRFPEWSPEGDRVVYSSSPRRVGLGAGPVATLGELRWVSAEGGEPTTIVQGDARSAAVTEGGDHGGRVYFTEDVPNSEPGFNANTTTAVVSVRLDGADKRTHAKISTKAGVEVRVSPDERSLLVMDRDDVYVLPLPAAGGDGIAVNFQSPSVPLRRITTEGANYAAWADGGSTVAWSFANHYYRAPLEAVMSDPESNSWGISHEVVTLTVPRSVPQGEVLLRGARIITMNGDEIIERGDLLVRNNRIVEVGVNVPAPPGAEVIDVSGTTIMPGIVDTHAHPKTGSELAPDQEWSIAANLAHGVTTTRNPSGTRWNVAWGELIDAGEMVGSRIYATGPPLTSNNIQVRNYNDALRAVRRYKAQGVNSLKQYLQPRRIQRQWILKAAHAEGINTTNEGAADLKMDISMAIDGFTGIEHSLGQVPLYKDVITLFAEAKIAYTPTLGVAYGGPAGDGYWRARVDLDKDPKSALFTPSELLVRTRRRPIIVEEDYNFPDIARGLRDIVRAGGIGGLGSHGQQDGIAAHWELWMLQSGDMTNMEALQIATIQGALSIGYETDLGSIEVGKLADLIVLNSNPLDDIRNSTDIRYVMKNGELYEGDTLDRVWPSARPFPIPHWVREQQALEALRGGN
ncbi:MAG: amidohydrolase family protein [Gemmatimonadales bacterium]|jgi:Tol biopolymer transport system component/imidazolonepropionase-like amidohydrolase|nr:amidohydrolase family protein [Gemmatimonadales bacterium]MBT3497327.1 amidohydrolase family protein [Gemmatimonadales bacterium]MBT3773874.1 amidohydrolase family protein [Gemmatimonadales bacterium]MBT3960020.1 amidohydrolase family protein [Gemmatimonadales bacterium]MBT4185943.1 amidohydrolase family protein [Gemmatimonadales bacterium]